jgi:2-polyprenyl-3-methyl-5-hydroxy-6-metoxy-1,4-benzoquinol methylase
LESCGPDGGLKVLDLGCGSGLLDICLAEMGAKVTAIDRIKPVLKIAQEETGGQNVEFIHGDLKEVLYPENSFDCILILETIGLMSKNDEYKLIENSFKWLRSGGKLIIDFPSQNMQSLINGAKNSR